MANENNKSSPQERGEKVYLPPLYHRLVEAEKNYTGDSKSGIIAAAVKRYYDSMPLDQKNNLLNRNRG
jgi:hypothetical protein